MSPLKALANDVRKNLETPPAELLARAQARGIALAPIRGATRTGARGSNENVRLQAEVKQLRGVVSELQAAVPDRDGLLSAWREFGAASSGLREAD